MILCKNEFWNFCLKKMKKKLFGNSFKKRLIFYFYFLLEVKTKIKCLPNGQVADMPEFEFSAA